MTKEEEIIKKRKEKIISSFKINNSWNWTRWLFHLSAIILFIYSFYVFSGYISETIYQDQYILTMRIRYILMAIFMEMIALNYKQNHINT